MMEGMMMGEKNKWVEGMATVPGYRRDSEPDASYQPHEYARLIPPPTEAEYRALCDSIREHGLRDPITLYEGKILDGCSRYRAGGDVGGCPELHFTDFKGSRDEALAFVMDRNVCRRHLTDDQRAAIAVDLANLKQGDNRFTVDPPIGGSTTQAAAAKTMKVSTRRVQRAAAVKKRDPAAHADVKSGKKKLAAALADVKARADKKPAENPPATVKAETVVAAAECETPLGHDFAEIRHAFGAWTWRQEAALKVTLAKGITPAQLAKPLDKHRTTARTTVKNLNDVLLSIRYVLDQGRRARRVDPDWRCFAELQEDVTWCRSNLRTVSEHLDKIEASVASVQEAWRGTKKPEAPVAA